MPRWVRFLSCTFTGLALSLVGALLAAGWWEGGAGFGPALLNFLSTAAFWYLVGLFGLLAMITLLLGRIAVNLYGLADAVGGVLAGALVALVYGAFLVATHASDWGGMLVALQRSWLPALIFTLPVALSGGFTGWLWQRLD